MAVELILQRTPDQATLLERRAELAAVRTLLAQREAETARLRTELRSFESRYFRQVGTLYAELDDLEARIAEREVALYDSDAARHRAAQARRFAQETHAAAYRNDAESPEFDPPPSLKTLFREVAKRIHPDFARDDDEQSFFTLLMARANQAYGRGDAEALQRMLDDQKEIATTVTDEAGSAELLRLARQMQHARRDLATLDAEHGALLASEIASLHADAEAAAREHRDLLAELAAGLREQIAEALRRFEFVDRQVSAHGR